MGNDFGISFVPGSGQGQGQAGPGVNPINPIQSAVQFLSLRLPRVTGAQGLAPGPLLQAPGGSGLAGPGSPGGDIGTNPLLMALLHLAGLFGGRGLTGQIGDQVGRVPQLPLPPLAGSAPLPHVIPGRGPIVPMPGPGTPTFPETGGGPTIDRRNPLAGNRFGGPTLNTSDTILPAPGQGWGGGWPSAGHLLNREL